MTDLAPALCALTIALPLAVGALVTQLRSQRAADRVSQAGALVTAAVALVLATAALVRSGEPVRGSVYVVDAAGGLFLATIAVVGLLSALVSPAYLRGRGTGSPAARRTRRWYYLELHAFWAVLLAIPLAGNLGVAWLLVEASTAASALLVAHSGTRHALEAGWKYLVLTTIGLIVALLGIVMLFAAAAPNGGSLSILDWESLERAAPALGEEATLVAFLLLLAGLATKIGWAPVHNWLPDAHSEAPAPVSALLSAALLPTIILVAWRIKATLAPAVGTETARGAFLAFGIASLAIAIPFLWRPLPWKRLLAYSSLEHMGVIAIGIGFGHPLAIAGVVLHVAGHALAKSLGFYAAVPLLRYQRSAATRPARGVASTSPAVASAMGVSLGSLSGLPPSPLFFSEVFVLLGGILAGETAVAAIAAVLLALGFLGLAHALIESLLGRPRGGHPSGRRSTRQIRALTVAVGAGLAALSAAAYALPGSALVRTLVEWTS
ncbi:MAG: hypothetical protein IT201_04285 [Thermoleophilia bacterium]|nr:hypothetical protein [Thermoleophilia bacterium]